ncbi:hypothetical protein IPG41_04085 [Candidatus Peregrinibacteria bacterium]|nr:MAG: hypothetical protein IPG41_04085 [Candidatus Peregrinibacteria bacterium]
MDHPIAILVCLLSIFWGFACIVNPKWGDLHSLNDYRQKRMYGERGYYFLIRYVTGPIFILTALFFLHGFLTGSISLEEVPVEEPIEEAPVEEPLEEEDGWGWTFLKVMGGFVLAVFLYGDAFAVMVKEAKLKKRT